MLPPPPRPPDLSLLTACDGWGMRGREPLSRQPRHTMRARRAAAPGARGRAAHALPRAQPLQCPPRRSCAAPRAFPPPPHPVQFPADLFRALTARGAACAADRAHPRRQLCASLPVRRTLMPPKGSFLPLPPPVVATALASAGASPAPLAARRAPRVDTIAAGESAPAAASGAQRPFLGRRCQKRKTPFFYLFAIYRSHGERLPPQSRFTEAPQQARKRAIFTATLGDYPRQTASHARVLPDAGCGVPVFATWWWLRISCV